MMMLYRTLTTLAEPAIHLLWWRRAGRGKEDKSRRKERFGHGAMPRPEGPLVWIHAASVGEAISVMPLIQHLHDTYSNLHILLTTGTVSSAKLITQQLPERAIHQFIPFDIPRSIRSFYTHWKPDMGIIIESELWPNLVCTAYTKNIPLYLVNARMSQRSYMKWQQARGFIKQLLDSFVSIFPGSRNDTRRFKNLGAHSVHYVGNLKYDAPQLKADSKTTAGILTMMGDHRPWLAASTHPGEEEYILKAHMVLQETYPELLCMIVPRHNARGDDIVAMCNALGLSASQRSKQEKVTERTDVYIADTMGELGVFYRLTGIAFVGGSLVARGGHNPIEPALLDCAIVCGPHMDNFGGIISEFEEAHAIHRVASAEELSQTVSELLRDTEKQEYTAKRAHELVEEKQGIISNLHTHISEKLTEIGAIAVLSDSTGDADISAPNAD